jgi:ribonuclease P protein component
MLPFPHRLKLPVTWNRRYPDRDHSTNLFKIIAKKVSTEPTKFGFIITTKVGKATVRNRLKRKLSEFIKDYLEKIEPGWEVVLIVHPAAASATDEDLSLKVNQALSKIPVTAPGH